MKEKQRETFFRLLKWLMILGTFWLIFGLIASVITLLEIEFFEKLFIKLGEIFVHLDQFIHTWILVPLYKWIIFPTHNYIIHHICVFIENIFGRNRYFFYYGSLSLILSLFFHLTIFSLKY